MSAPEMRQPNGVIPKIAIPIEIRKTSSMRSAADEVRPRSTSAPMPVTFRTVEKKVRTDSTRPSGSRPAHRASWYSRAHGISAHQPFTPDFSNIFQMPTMYAATSAAWTGLSVPNASRRMNSRASNVPFRIRLSTRIPPFSRAFPAIRTGDDCKSQTVYPIPRSHSNTRIIRRFPSFRRVSRMRSPAHAPGDAGSEPGTRREAFRVPFRACPAGVLADVYCNACAGAYNTL